MIVLDANVLFSNSLRGLFLWLAMRRVCDPIWTQEIWNEVFRNYSTDEAVKEKFQQNIQQIISSRFSESMRTLKMPFVDLGLPDKNDEHIVALARQEEINTIVTFNLKDFPNSILNGIGMMSCHPDLFLCNLYESYPEDVKAAVYDQIKSHRKSQTKKSSYFESLSKANVKQFAKKLEEVDSINQLFPEVWV